MADVPVERLVECLGVCRSRAEYVRPLNGEPVMSQEVKLKGEPPRDFDWGLTTEVVNAADRWWRRTNRRTQIPGCPFELQAEAKATRACPNAGVHAF
jgi:hypothetical protein